LKYSNTPITTNAIAAVFCITIGGIYLFKNEPRITPTKEEHTRAIDDPKKTAIFELDSAERSIVVICVLSPNSAIKTKKNVETIIFNIKSS
jgi:hypothetical protein